MEVKKIMLLQPPNNGTKAAEQDEVDAKLTKLANMLIENH
jgi:hypothetical protein